MINDPGHVFRVRLHEFLDRLREPLSVSGNWSPEAAYQRRLVEQLQCDFADALENKMNEIEEEILEMNPCE